MSSFILGLTLCCSLVHGYGQTSNYLLDQFDTDTTAFWSNQSWGTAVPAVTWDSAMNATTTMGPNSPGSGSAKLVINWPAAKADDQVVVKRNFNGSTAEILNLNDYSSISFDIRFDPASATDGAGNFGILEVDWVPTTDGWPSTPNSTSSITFAVTATNWIHVNLPIDATISPKLKSVNGIGFKMQQNKTGTSLKGTTTFWVDNVIFCARLHPK